MEQDGVWKGKVLQEVWDSVCGRGCLGEVGWECWGNGVKQHLLGQQRLERDVMKVQSQVWAKRVGWEGGMRTGLGTANPAAAAGLGPSLIRKHNSRKSRE